MDFLKETTYLHVEVAQDLWAASRNWLNHMIPPHRSGNDSEYSVYVVHVDTAIVMLRKAKNTSPADMRLLKTLLIWKGQYPQAEYVYVGRL